MPYKGLMRNYYAGGDAPACAHLLRCVKIMTTTFSRYQAERDEGVKAIEVR